MMQSERMLEKHGGESSEQLPRGQRRLRRDRKPQAAKEQWEQV